MGDISTVSEITKVLEYLEDGEWHAIEEIGERMKLNKGKIQQIIMFLSEYNFIVIDQKMERVRLTETIRRFLTQVTGSEEPSSLCKPSRKPCPFQ